MQLSLEGSGERWALLGLSSVLCAILIFQASESWIADRRMRSGKLALIERGAELQPGNGEAWDRVGRFWQLDFTNPDSSMAEAVRAGGSRRSQFFVLLDGPGQRV